MFPLYPPHPIASLPGPSAGCAGCPLFVTPLRGPGGRTGWPGWHRGGGSGAPRGAGSIPGVVSNQPVLEGFSAPFSKDYLFNCSLNSGVRAPSAALRGGRGAGWEGMDPSPGRAAGTQGRLSPAVPLQMFAAAALTQRGQGMRRFCPGARWV